MTSKEYNDYKKTFSDNVDLLKAKGGSLNRRYWEWESVYLENKYLYRHVYNFEAHLEDLENGLAPETPGVFDGGFSRIDERRIDNEILRGKW